MSATLDFNPLNIPQWQDIPPATHMHRPYQRPRLFLTDEISKTTWLLARKELTDVAPSDPDSPLDRTNSRCIWYAVGGSEAGTLQAVEDSAKKVFSKLEKGESCSEEEVSTAFYIRRVFDYSLYRLAAAANGRGNSSGSAIKLDLVVLKSQEPLWRLLENADNERPLHLGAPRGPTLYQPMATPTPAFAKLLAWKARLVQHPRLPTAQLSSAAEIRSAQGRSLALMREGESALREMYKEFGVDEERSLQQKQSRKRSRDEEKDHMDTEVDNEGRVSEVPPDIIIVDQPEGDEGSPPKKKQSLSNPNLPEMSKLKISPRFASPGSLRSDRISDAEQRGSSSQPPSQGPSQGSDSPPQSFEEPSGTGTQRGEELRALFTTQLMEPVKCVPPDEAQIRAHYDGWVEMSKVAEAWTCWTGSQPDAQYIREGCALLNSTDGRGTRKWFHKTLFDKDKTIMSREDFLRMTDTTLQKWIQGVSDWKE